MVRTFSSQEVKWTHRHSDYSTKIAILIDTIAITPQRRASAVLGLLNGISSKCRLFTRVCMRALLHLHKRAHAPLCADLFTIKSPGHLLLYSPYLYLAEFL